MASQSLSGFTIGKVYAHNIYKGNQKPDAEAYATDEVVRSKLTAIVPGDPKVSESGKLYAQIQ